MANNCRTASRSTLQERTIDTRVWTFFSRLCFVTGLACSAPAALDDAIQAEVERPELVSDAARDPYLAGFKITFDARFTNRSENPVDIPDRDRGPDGASWITVISVESQQQDGSWRFVVNPGVLMWKSDTKFVPCKSLRPKETAEVENVSNRFVIFRGPLAGLGPKPTVRFNLVLACRQQDGTLHSKSVDTDPFVLSIPSRP